MEAIHAESPEAALEVLRQDVVDLLITDLVKAVRRQTRHKRMSVWMIAGRAEKEHILQASRIGVNSFVAKPFDSDPLKQKIFEACRARRQQLINRQIAQLLKGRENLHGKPEGPRLVMGEAIKSSARRRSSTPIPGSSRYY